MKPRAIDLLPSLAWITCSVALSCPGSDWPQWRGPDRNGISPETLSELPPNGPKLLWSASVGTGFSSISVNAGRLYTMGNSGELDTIWCLDALTGREIWKHSYAARLDPQFYEGGPGATPTVRHGKVFTISKWGSVFSLDASSGAIAWQHNLWDEAIRSNRWGFASSPLIWNDLLILNAGGAGTALNRSNGRMVWFNGTEPAGYASPVLVKLEDQEIVLIFAAKYLVAIDPKTGRILWRHPFQTGYDTNNMDPVVLGRTVLLSSYTHACELLRIEPDKAELIYTKDILHNHLSPGVLFGEYLYAFNGEAHHQTDFRCIHVPTGEVKWSTKTPAFGTVVGLGGNRLLTLSEKGELTLASASPGEWKPVSRAQIMGGVCWTPPTLANGRLYVRNAKGDLKCLELLPQPPTH